MRVNQISVFLENKSGRLSDVTRTLADNNINIRALSIADTIDYGLLRLIVNDPDLATQVLTDNGFTVARTEVLAVEIPDRPGGLAGVIDILAAKNLNIEYMYAFVGRSGDHAIVVFRIEPVEDAITVLQEGGMRILRGEELHSL
ncbi:MAG TPA: ACT domain-containing protein [Armatimonadota bacterium]|nr:ACT domain-containing protein [Armatimonadota bacterium]HPP74502.1 ACT domain-containing protein [Armatimonadota bacterium]